jgi:hypothetical protein
MGAQTFYTHAFGADVNEAFAKAKKEAENYYGHQGGYSGHINMKDSVTVIPEEEHKGRQKRNVAHELIEEDDDRISSKWGPAGAIDISGTKKAREYRKRNGLEGKHGSVFLFFGWAPC